MPIFSNNPKTNQDQECSSTIDLSLSELSSVERSQYNEPTKVTFFGDSNVDWNRDRNDSSGFCDIKPPLNFPVGFVEQVGALTDQAGNPKYDTLNRGFAGYKVSDLNSEITKLPESDQLEIFKSDVVVIAVGINDANAKPSSTPVEDFKKSYEKLLENVDNLAPDKPIILVVPFTLNGVRDDLNPIVQEYAKVINELAAKNDNIHIVDPRKELAATKLDDYVNPSQNDGIHPSVKGHKIIADLVSAKIESLTD